MRFMSLWLYLRDDSADVLRVNEFSSRDKVTLTFQLLKVLLVLHLLVKKQQMSMILEKLSFLKADEFIFIL